MELQYWIWISVGLSFSLYIGIAIWSRAGSTKEFYVAGGGVHPIANFVVTLIISSRTPAPSKDIQELVVNIRKP